MKEIYRSFEGVLGVENQAGYIVYDTGKFWEIHELSVHQIGAEKFRISKNVQFDWTDSAEVGRVEISVTSGAVDGQAWYKGKWYSTETIHKIQADNQELEWRKCV